MLRVGVIIPAIKSHIRYLPDCLTSIEKQTYKPTVVAISFSECGEEDLPKLDYSFPIRIVSSKDSQTAGYNRNQAAKLIEPSEVDIISCFDADDEMLPTRLEFLVRGFQENNGDVLVHGMVVYDRPDKSMEPKYTAYECYNEAFYSRPEETSLQFKNPSFKETSYANGWTSISSKLWALEKFETGENSRLQEDSEYNKRVFNKGYKVSYLRTQLGIYKRYHGKLRIAYLIITSDSQINNRVQYQLNTFLKLVNPEDIYFLSSVPNSIDKRVYGWNTDDNINSLKLIHFMRNVVLDYDWYIILEDNTFIFPKRLENFLVNFGFGHIMWIGRNINNPQFRYMSGGAGSVISHDFYQILLKLLRMNDLKLLNYHSDFDVCLGLFTLLVSRSIHFGILMKKDFILINIRRKRS